MSWKGTSRLPILPAQVWICSLPHLEVIQSVAGTAQRKREEGTDIANSSLGCSHLVFPAPRTSPQTLTTVAILHLTPRFPHSQHHTALRWWQRKTYSSPWGPHTLSTTSRRLVTDPEIISLGLGSLIWKDYANEWIVVFPPSSVNINDPHSISLPFLHFTRWLHLVVAHFTT